MMVGRIVIQPRSISSSPNMTPSAMKLSRPSVSMSGTMPMAVEISVPRPTFAPSSRYQVPA